MSENVGAEESGASDSVIRVVKFVVDEKALSKHQRDLFLKHADTSRDVWNWARSRWLIWRDNCRWLVWAMAYSSSTPSEADDKRNLVDLARYASAGAAARQYETSQEWRKSVTELAEALFPRDESAPKEDKKRTSKGRIEFMRALAFVESGFLDIDLASETFIHDVLTAAIIAHARYDNKKWRDAAFAMARELRGENYVFESNIVLDRLFTCASKDPESPFYWWVRDAKKRTNTETGKVHEKHGVSRNAINQTLPEFSKATKAFWSRAKNGQPVVGRNGKLLGLPKYKDHSDGNDHFTIQSLSAADGDPWKPIEGGHRIRIPNLGSIRMHRNTRPLRQLIEAGGRPTSARFVKQGGRWTVSINVKFPGDHPFVATRKPTATQVRNGVVGVDVGVKKTATTFATNGETTEVANPRLYFQMCDQLRLLQRKLDRQHRAGSPDCFNPDGTHVKGCNWGRLGREGSLYVDRQGNVVGIPMSASARRTKVAIARLQARTATERQRVIHLFTKQLTTTYAAVGIEDLNVKGMTASVAPKSDGKGGFERNGKAAKGGLNKAILDVSFAEIRRQLEYKAELYGSRVVAIDRFYASSKTCSNPECDSADDELSLSDRTYSCKKCGLTIDRDLNAAINIQRLAVEMLQAEVQVDVSATSSVSA